MASVAKVTSALGAAALATSMVAGFEGIRQVGYADIAGVPTVCWGHTETAVVGRFFSMDKCLELLAKELAVYGVRIAHCLPDELPVESRAAFISMSYNVGVTGFCGSRAAQLARAGDVAGACKAMNTGADGRKVWVYAGGEYSRGLDIRRAKEREFCEQGLKRLA